MEQDTVIKVEGLYKKFSKSLKRGMVYGTVELLDNIFRGGAHSTRLRKSEFWALEDINFELKKGEILGIVGVNGSGKSTLLRLLTGIFPPDRGSIMTKGRIGGLIAVGAGFHPHMTGRENVYLNATILGMTSKEIDERFEQIVDFAEIGEFLDAPVSTYSSGMKVRLGFAIAIHIDPEILLIDEILSVGDLSFRNKSLRKMNEYREKAKGIIFISHNLEQVRNLCTRVIVLDRGKVIYDGNTDEGCVLYEEMNRDILMESMRKERLSDGEFADRIFDNDQLELVKAGLVQADGSETDQIGMRDRLRMMVEFEAKVDLPGVYFSIGITDGKSNNVIWVVSNDGHKQEFTDVRKGKYELLMEIPEHHLKPGVYTPTVAIRNSDTGETYERALLRKTFKVVSEQGHMERGMIAVEESWTLNAVN